MSEEEKYILIAKFLSEPKKIFYQIDDLTPLMITNSLVVLKKTLENCTDDDIEQRELTQRLMSYIVMNTLGINNYIEEKDIFSYNVFFGIMMFDILEKNIILEEKI